MKAAVHSRAQTKGGWLSPPTPTQAPAHPRYRGRVDLSLAVRRELAVLELLARVQVAPTSSVTARDIAWTLGWVDELFCPVTAGARARGVLLRLRARAVVESVHPKGPGRGYPCAWKLLPGWRKEVKRLRGEVTGKRGAA